MRRGISLKNAFWLFLLFMLWGLSSFTFIYAQTLEVAIKHYQAGEFDEAKRILLNQWAEQEDNPEIMFYLGKTEEKGELSIKYYQDMTDCYPDHSKSDEAELLILKYEFCRGMHVTAVDLAERFQKDFPQSEMIPEVLWTSGCSYLAMDQLKLALAQFNEIINLFPGSGWANWAQLGRGDYLIAEEDYHQAIAAYNKALEVQPESEALPFALSGLVRCFTQLGDKERALLYYNLLKERYPYSVESITDPAEKMNLNNKAKNRIEAERLAGVRYTIQLGVFGIKENALKLRSTFEKQGFSVTIKGKIIAGKEYHVVRVGKFTSYEEALKLKKKLEAQTGESYRIVMM